MANKNKKFLKTFLATTALAALGCASVQPALGVNLDVTAAVDLADKDDKGLDAPWSPGGNLVSATGGPHNVTTTATTGNIGDITAGVVDVLQIDHVIQFGNVSAESINITAEATGTGTTTTSAGDLVVAKANLGDGDVTAVGGGIQLSNGAEIGTGVVTSAQAVTLDSSTIGDTGALDIADGGLNLNNNSSIGNRAITVTKGDVLLDNSSSTGTGLLKVDEGTTTVKGGSIVGGALTVANNAGAITVEGASTVTGVLTAGDNNNVIANDATFKEVVTTSGTGAVKVGADGAAFDKDVTSADQAEIAGDTILKGNFDASAAGLKFTAASKKLSFQGAAAAELKGAISDGLAANGAQGIIEFNAKGGAVVGAVGTDAGKRVERISTADGVSLAVAESLTLTEGDVFLKDLNVSGTDATSKLVFGDAAKGGNTYDITSLDLKESAITMQVTANNAKSAFKIDSVAGVQNATLDVDDTTSLNNASFATFKEIDIADTKTLSFDLKDGTETISFLNNAADSLDVGTNSVLSVKTATDKDLTMTIANNQIKGAANGDLKVKLEVENGRKMTVNGAAQTNGFGSSGQKLQSLELVGAGAANEKMTINVDTYAKSLSVGSVGTANAEVEGSHFTKKLVLNNVGGDAITYNADGRLSTAAGSQITGDLDAKNQTAFFSLGAGSTFTGKMDETTTDDKLTVRFNNQTTDESTVTGGIGETKRANLIEVEQNAKVKVTGEIKVNGAKGIHFVAGRNAETGAETAFAAGTATTAASTAQFTMGSDLTADGGGLMAINFNGQTNAKVILDAAVASTITGNIVTGGTEKLNVGTLEVKGAADHKFVGKIGDATKSLGLNSLNFSQAGKELTLELKADSQINTLNIADAGSTVVLNQAVDSRINSITGAGTLKVEEDLTFLSGKDSNGNAIAVNFGSATTALAKLDLVDKTMTVGKGGTEDADKFNIYASDLNNTAGGGGIVYKSGGVFSVKTTNAANQKLQGLNLDADGKTLEVPLNFHAENNAVITKGTINFGGSAASDAGFEINGDNGAFTFAGDVTGEVKTGTDLKGIVTFGNEQAATADKLGNGTENFAQVVFKNQNQLTITDLKLKAGSDAKFVFADNGNVNSRSVVETDAATTQDFTGDNVVVENTSGREVTVKSTGIGGVAAARTWEGKYGSANGIVALDSGTQDATLKTNGAENGQYARILSTGKVDFGQASQRVYAIGSEEASVGALTFNQDLVSVENNVYATTISVDPNKTATIKGTFNRNIALGDGARVNLGSASTGTSVYQLSSANSGVFAATALTNGKGVVNFQASNVVVDRDLGDAASRLGNVNFNENSVSSVQIGSAGREGDIYAVDTNFADKKVTVAESSTIGGNANFTAGGELSLGAEQLTVSAGNANFTGDYTINVKVVASSRSSFSDTGVIKIDSNKLVSTGGVVTIIVDDAQADDANNLPLAAGREFTVIDGTTGEAVTFEKAPIIKSKLLTTVGWTGVIGDKKLTLAQSNQAGAVFNTLNLTGNSSDNLDKFVSAESGDAEKVLGRASSLFASGNSQKVEDLFDRLNNNNSQAGSDAVEGGFSGNVVNTIDTSVSSLVAGRTVDVSPVSAAPAAGDDDSHRYGVWMSPFYSSAKQSARKSVSGYDAESYGATFGFDTLANDDLLLGAAVSFIDTTVKHKDKKNGDKTTANSTYLSLYGAQTILDNWYVQGVASFGNNNVKNREQRVLDESSNQVAKASYDSMSFAGDVKVGYNYVVDEFVVTPMAGLRYLRANDSGYSEEGTDFQNLKITKKAANKLEGVLGLRLQSMPFEFNGVEFTPEMRGSVSHDFIAKNPKVDARLSGIEGSLSTKAEKPADTFYSVGAGVNAKFGMMEYGVNVDYHGAEKYNAVVGALQVRVNF